MASRVYSIEHLLHLRESSLVQKPDGLPSIDQWMEGSKPQSSSHDAARRKLPNNRDDTSQDNILAKIAATGGRRRQEGDILLAPPKMGFTSNHRSTADKRFPGPLTDDIASKDRADFQDGFFRSRTSDTQSNRDKSSTGSLRRPRESENNRWDRSDDRERDRRPRESRDTDALDAPLRRNGIGRGRSDGNWLRLDNADADTPRSDLRSLSWRDRDKERDRERDRDRDGDKHRRDWTRYPKTEIQEEEPEWLNDQASVPEEKQARTQEDFTRWREQQKQKAAPQIEASTPIRDTDNDEDQLSKPIPTTTKSTPAVPTLGNAFAAFQIQPTEDDAIDQPSRPPISKKASRFEGLFKKEDAVIDHQAQPREPLTRPLSSDQVPTKNEDQEGFQRILQMLGNKGLTPRPSETPTSPPDSRFAGLDGPFQRHDGTRDQQRDSTGFIDDLLARQAQQRSSGGLEAAHPDLIKSRQYAPPDPSRIFSDRSDDAPKHDLHTHQRETLHTSAARNEHLDPKRAFLLNLMNARMTEPSQGEHLTLAHLAQPQQAHHSNQRNTPSAPPGLDQHHRPAHDQEISGNRRLPPGFFTHDQNMDTQAVPPGLTRRNTTEANNSTPQMNRIAPTQASNLGIPSMRANEALIVRSGGHIGIDGRMISGPPPGLMPNANHHMSAQGPPVTAPMSHSMANGSLRHNIPPPPMNMPFPPGMPPNMHAMPPGPPPIGPGHFPMGPPPPHPNHFFSPPGMPPMGGPGGQNFFSPTGRGFPPPNFEADARERGRGYQGM